MVCQPLNIVGGHSEVAYMWQITGVGPSFWECQREIVQCLECKMELVVWLLKANC